MLVFWCSWSLCSFLLQAADGSDSHTQREHALAGGDQGGGGGVGTRGEEGAIDCYRDGETCPWPRGETRRGCAPPALYVPDDSQLMSYLGQSTPGIVCKGEKSMRKRESDTITEIEQKKKKVV